MKLKNVWTLWAKAIGEKASECNKESDKIAVIRTVIFATYLITNCFIVANAIRHWNNKTEVYVEIHSIEPVIPEVRVHSGGEFE